MASGDLRALLGAAVKEGEAANVNLLPLYVARACFDIQDELARRAYEKGSARRADPWRRIQRGELDALDVVVASDERGIRRLNAERVEALALGVARAARAQDEERRIALENGLPLLDTRDPQAPVAVRPWLAHRDVVLRTEASIVIAEHANIREAEVFKHLADAQRSNVESQALRACCLLASGNFWTDRPPPTLLASQLEPGLLMHLGTSIATRWDDPLRSEYGAKAALCRFAGDVMFDDAEHFGALIDEAGRDSGMIEVISHASSADAPVVACAIDRFDKVSAPVGEALLAFVARALARDSGVLPGDIEGAKVYERLLELRYYPQRVGAVAQALNAALAERKPRTAQEAAEFVEPAAKAFREQGLVGVGQAKDPAGVVEALKARYADSVIWSLSGWFPKPEKDGPSAHVAMENVVKTFGAKPCANVLVAWLASLLKTPRQTREESFELLYVAFAADILSSQSPDLFWRAVIDQMDPARFSQLLQEVGFRDVQYGHLFVPAVRTLARCGRMEAGTLTAMLKQADAPDPFCQEIVGHALMQLGDIAPEAVDVLLDAVDQRAPRIASLAARTAASIARDAMVRPALRQHIVERLNASVAKPRSAQVEWLFIPGSENEPGQVVKTGTLRRNIARALRIIDRGI